MKNIEIFGLQVLRQFKVVQKIWNCNENYRKFLAGKFTIADHVGQRNCDRQLHLWRRFIFFWINPSTKIIDYNSRCIFSLSLFCGRAGGVQQDYKITASPCQIAPDYVETIDFCGQRMMLYGSQVYSLGVDHLSNRRNFVSTFLGMWRFNRPLFLLTNLTKQKHEGHAAIFVSISVLCRCWGQTSRTSHEQKNDDTINSEKVQIYLPPNWAKDDVYKQQKWSYESTNFIVWWGSTVGPDPQKAADANLRFTPKSVKLFLTFWFFWTNEHSYIL